MTTNRPTVRRPIAVVTTLATAMLSAAGLASVVLAQPQSPKMDTAGWCTIGSAEVGVDDYTVTTPEIDYPC